MFKDDSKLLRMSIYRPKKQGYRYKQLYAKYGRYAQNSTSEVLSANVRSPGTVATGMRLNSSIFEFCYSAATVPATVCYSIPLQCLLQYSLKTKYW